VTTTPALARDERVRDFLGAKIKNIVGLGEISAAGLPGEVGAAFTQVPADSAAAGFTVGEVILKCGTVEVHTADDLLKAFDAVPKGQKVALDVWRLQKRMTIEITVN